MDQFVNNNQNNYIVYTLGVQFLEWFRRFFLGFLYNIYYFMKSRVYFSAKISHGDVMYIQLLEWLSTQKTYSNSKAVKVISNTKTPSESVAGVITSINSINVSEPSNMNRTKLVPSGSLLFFYKKRLASVTLNSVPKHNLSSSTGSTTMSLKDDSLELKVFFGSKYILNDILKTAHKFYTSKNSHSSTKIFTMVPNCQIWVSQFSQQCRDIDSVFLDKDMKKDVINDMNQFIKSREWYLSTGISYRRGYLMYGPPGTGKTSFILGLAAYFNRSISIINLGQGVNDSSLFKMLHRTPPNTILVLEDIDSACITRKNTNTYISDDYQVTLNGLITAIEGLPSANDGRILIMTTNHFERLPSSFINIVNKEIKFDLAKPSQIKKMYKRFFDSSKYHLLPTILEQLKNHSISTAQLQGLFIQYRTNPISITSTCIESFIKESESENALLSNNY